MSLYCIYECHNRSDDESWSHPEVEEKMGLDDRVVTTGMKPTCIYIYIYIYIYVYPDPMSLTSMSGSYRLLCYGTTVEVE
jgi:hypothetical protein